jgi:hypothetical protein
MTVPGHSDELTSRTRRTLRFRLPLFIALAFNGVLLIRAPLAEALLFDSPPNAGGSAATAPSRAASSQASSQPAHVVYSAAGSATAAKGELPPAVTTSSARTSEHPPASWAIPPRPTLTDAATARHDSPGKMASDRGRRDVVKLVGQGLDAKNADALFQPAWTIADVPRQGWNLLARRWAEAIHHQAHTSGAAGPTVDLGDGPVPGSRPNPRPGSEPDLRPADGQVSDRPVAEVRELRLHNPPYNSGVVHVLVGETRLSLPAGASYIVRGESRWTIRYHRGDSLGNAVHVWGPGSYAFEVGDQGWNLVPVPPGSSHKGSSPSSVQ